MTELEFFELPTEEIAFYVAFYDKFSGNVEKAFFELYKGRGREKIDPAVLSDGFEAIRVLRYKTEARKFNRREFGSLAAAMAAARKIRARYSDYVYLPIGPNHSLSLSPNERNILTPPKPPEAPKPKKAAKAAEYSIKQAAKILGVSTTTIKRWIDRGEVPAAHKMPMKYGPAWVIPEKTLKKLKGRVTEESRFSADTPPAPLSGSTPVTLEALRECIREELSKALKPKPLTIGEPGHGA